MITPEEIEKLREVLGNIEPSIFPIKVIENSVLASNVVVVSSAIFKVIQKINKEDERTAASRPEKED